MASKAEETAATLTYELTCTDCAYETIVDGSVSDVLDAMEAHQEEHQGICTRHSVDCELIERNG